MMAGGCRCQQEQQCQGYCIAVRARCRLLWLAEQLGNSAQSACLPGPVIATATATVCRLTDGKGRMVSFANTVVIMTSNLGASIMLEHGNSAEARAAVMEVVRRHFRPEFLNRIDEIVQVGRLFDCLMFEQFEAGGFALWVWLVGQSVRCMNGQVELLWQSGTDAKAAACPIQAPGQPTENRQHTQVRTQTHSASDSRMSPLPCPLPLPAV